MKIALFITFLAIHTHLHAQENVSICEPISLKCEHLNNPMGVDIPNPRLTWMLKDTRQGAMQTAYQLLVGTDSIAVSNNIGERWDTGKQSKSDIIVSYKGKRLDPLTKYYWKVNVWDKNGKPSSSEISTFETGMMGRSNWK